MKLSTLPRNSRRRGTATILGTIALITLAVSFATLVVARAEDSRRIAARSVARAQHQAALDGVRAALQAGAFTPSDSPLIFGAFRAEWLTQDRLTIQPEDGSGAAIHVPARTYRITRPAADGIGVILELEARP